MGHIASIDVVSGSRLDADLLAVGCFENEAPAVDGLTGEGRLAVERLAARAGFKGAEEQRGQTEAGPGGPVVGLYGLGARRDFTYPKLVAWAGRLSEEARHGGERRVVVSLPAHPETSGAAAGRILRSLALAPYRFDRFQSDADSGGRVERLAVIPPAGEESAYRDALAVAGPVASAVAFARDLANSPANEATPTWMEARSRELAAASGLAVTVLDAKELAARGMGGLLAVGAGSAHSPRLVRLQWGDRGPRVALVGKGITFDTGGISIKPAADMDEMKYDKSGACAVLATARAVAELALPVRLTVYAPFAENMLSHEAYRPSDIVRCHNGRTVEITNTDAEGRMILADALSWAAEDKPDALVELSTLTGACVVALGHAAAGLFTTDDGLAGELAAAGEREGERLWRLPLFPEYLEEMKGTHADLRNSAGRWGGASLAAAFLSQFVGEVTRWAHLDIAGVANVKGSPGGPAAGATGFGVAALVSWLRRLAE
ncbi:MAG TPA: leucyl aminopeptidase [Thermoanaerobaculia bacterium]|nr:leucyl aminopeptidase [Thermoanaerobaculia bacterium]